MFNDAGVIATTRTLEDGTIEPGFRVYVAGGLGANPHPALALEEFTPREDLLPTLEAILRVFEQTGNRKNKLRARLKWVVNELGWDEVQSRILAIRRLLPASSSWPGGIPEVVTEWGDAAAGRSATVAATPMGQGTPVAFRSTEPYERWAEANVIRGAENGHGIGLRLVEARRRDLAQFRGLASATREFRRRGSDHEPSEPRVPQSYARINCRCCSSD